jgi:hypothetical protein
MRTAINCIINGVQVMEVQIKTYAGLQVEAAYALVHHYKQGKTPMQDTHGKCTAGPGAWSKETLERLQELLESMETDLISRHFEGDGEGAEENAGTFIGGRETPPQV